MLITPQQIRAARALLKWGQDELSSRSGVSVPAIANIENEKQQPNAGTQQKIVLALQEAGIELIEGGVRQVQDLIRVFEGEDCYLRMLDEAFITLAPVKGEILFSASDERRTPANVLEKFRAMRRGDIRFRSLVKDQDTFLMGDVDEYRWMDQRLFVDGDVKVIFADRVAYLMTWKDQKKVILIKDARIADEQRRLFDFIWGASAKPTHSTSKIKYEESVE